MAVSSRRQFSVEKGICHMSETTITQLPDPSGFSSDPFTDVLRDGARKLIEQAIHAELATLMNAFSKEKLEDGRARLVRHGHLPEREVMTGIGPVPVKVPRVRDRGIGEDKITFTPSILPRYLRKGQRPSARHLAGRDESRSERRLRFLRRNLRREMGQGGSQVGQGQGCAADLL